MGLNCKPDDLAYVVTPEIGTNTGKIVRCIRLVPNKEVCDYFNFRRTPYGDIWLIEGSLDWLDKDYISPKRYAGPYCPDRYLRPFRPDSKPEETETERKIENEMERVE